MSRRDRRKEDQPLVGQHCTDEFREITGREFDFPVKVVGEDEAEKADCVVCMPLGTFTPFTDNLTDRCCVCAREVMVRPSAPKSPPRLCWPCYLDGKTPPPKS